MKCKNMTRGNILRRTTLAAALSVSFAGVALAQSNTTGTIFGSAQAGSTVEVKNESTGQTRDFPVGNDGRYRAGSLAVGQYQVILQREGQVISTRNNVQVNVGGGVDISFASASGAQNLEGISVVASALPSIDVSQVDTRTVLTSEQLSKIPVQRGVTAAALLAPGTVAGDSRYGNVASFGGASAAENQYYVNGFPVTNSLTGIGFTELPFDAIDQQQVITGGYGAEYGRSTGGVVNIVTKSGGNEWKAGAEAFWTPRVLTDSPRSIYYPNNPGSARAGEIAVDRSGNKSWTTDYNAYISGPLIKDRLFFYFTGQQVKTQGSKGLGLNTGAGDTAALSERKSSRYLTKINWNINDDNILELTGLLDDESNDITYYNYDYQTGARGAYAGAERIKNGGVAGSTPGGKMYVGKYTSYITDDLTITALYGKSKTDHVDSTVGPSGAPCPVVVDARQLPASQAYNNCFTSTFVQAPGAKDKTQAYRFDISYQIGDHSLRGGIDNQNLSSFGGQAYSGGNFYRYVTYENALNVVDIANSFPGFVAPNPTPDYVVRTRMVVNAANVSVKQQAQYIEDHWQITDRWLGYIGLRNEQFSNYNGSNERYVAQRHQLAPRLGLTWDVFGDSSLKIYANAGRQHLAIPANVAIRGASAALDAQQYFTYTGVDPVTGAATGLTPITDVRFVNGADGVTSPDPKTVGAKGLSAYYQDEYILGFDKTLGSDWVVGAKATYRKLGSIIDDFCDSAPFESYASRNGIDITNARISGCYLFNPGKNNTFTVDVGDGNFQDFKLTKQDFAANSNGIGFPDLERKYLSLDVYLAHQFADNWYGKVEYVWSKNYGDSEGLLKSDIGQTDPSVTQDWDFPELMIGSRGDLPNDRRHQLKAYGFWQQSPEWLFGANLAVASGRPKNCIGNGPTGYDRQSYGAAFFFCDFTSPTDDTYNPVVTPRGSQGRLPWTYQLNLNAQYTPDWANNKLAFTADVFNIFTQQRKVSIVETKTSQTDPSYGRVLTYQAPRSVRVGIRYDFSL